MKHLKYFLEFIFIIFLFLIFKLIGLKLSRILASYLFANLGPFFRSKKTIYSNISLAFPNSEDNLKKNISKNGLVKKETEVQKMLSDFLNTLDQSSLYFVQSKNAYIKGKKGNQEIFVHLKRR